MRRLIIIGIIIATLLFGVAQAQFVPQKPSKWYTIEPWEVAVCSKWGGRKVADKTQNVEEGLVGFGPFTYSALGKKRKLRESNETLYTYAYYMQSYAASMQYTIDLYNDETRERKHLAGGDLGPNTGVMDARVEYLTEDFKYIRIIHQFGRVLIPLVEVEE